MSTHQREHTHEASSLDGLHADELHAPGRRSRSLALSAPQSPVSSGLLMRKADSARDDNGVMADADAAVERASGSSGAPLPTHIQRQFEDSLGADLSGVRVHSGSESQEATHAVGAKAYTVGNDIHFAAGKYQPDDPSGMHLLAHEVAHTVQQSGGAQRRQNKLEVSTPQDAAEHEADRAADAMVRGEAVTVVGSAGRIARKTPEGEATKKGEPDKEQMVEVEKHLLAMIGTATSAGEEIAASSDACIQAAQAAMSHLKTSLANYTTAYNNVKTKLGEAQTAYEIEQAVTGAVKDVVFGLLGPVMPQAVAVKSLVTMAKLEGSFGAELVSLGAGLASSGAGKLQEAPAAAPPKESISGVGLTPGDKALEAFNSLADIVGALPAVSSDATRLVKLGTIASLIATEAAKVAAGQKAKLSGSALVDRATRVQALLDSAMPKKATAAKARQQVKNMSLIVTSQPQLEVAAIELKMWTQWMASRKTRPEKDLIDNDVIEKHLMSLGLLSGQANPGSYMSDQDEDNAVVEAQKKILKEKNVAIPDRDDKVTSLYLRETKCDALKAKYVGKTGQITAENVCAVDGATFSCPGNAGAQVGESIEVKWFVPRAHRQDPNIVLAQWNDDDFDLLGSKPQ